MRDFFTKTAPHDFQAALYTKSVTLSVTQSPGSLTWFPMKGDYDIWYNPTAGRDCPIGKIPEKQPPRALQLDNA
jgi:hypothetical protein